MNKILILISVILFLMIFNCYNKETFALPESFEPPIISNKYMDVRDLYTNLCPRGYNLKQIKLGKKVDKVNQLPGYTNNEFIDLTRKFPYPKVPFPTPADILTPLNY